MCLPELQGCEAISLMLVAACGTWIRGLRRIVGCVYVARSMRYFLLGVCAEGRKVSSPDHTECEERKTEVAEVALLAQHEVI